MPCPFGLESDAGRTICICPDGQYGIGQGADVECRDCPEGGVCQAGDEYSTIATKPNYWRKDNSSEFFRCLPGDCSGGMAGVCPAHRTAVLCAKCDEGYTQLGGDCVSCPSEGLAKMYITILIIGIALGLMFLYWLVLLADRRQMDKIDTGKNRKNKDKILARAERNLNRDADPASE